MNTSNGQPMLNTLYVACDQKIATKICSCSGISQQISISSACPAGTRTEYTLGSNSVLLDTGAFVFQQALLSIDTIGSSSFHFGLNYAAGQPGSRALGIGLQFAQNIRLSRFENGDIILDSGNFTHETFTFDPLSNTYSSTHNNTAAELRVEDLDTAGETYVLSASDGTVTRFFGFHEDIPTPGQIHTTADRYGNTTSFDWIDAGGFFQLVAVTDAYGRTVHYRYDGADRMNRLREIEDFLGRHLTFQYDAEGRLVAAITPAILNAAPGNTFPDGTAYAFQYDTGNPRPERRDDLIRIWYPNQATPFIHRDAHGERYVDLVALQQQATPRYSVTYGQDPTQPDTWGKVLRETIGDPDPANGVGGTVVYKYITDQSQLPASIFADPQSQIVRRTTVIDRNGNITHYDFNPEGMVIRKEVVANRHKSSLQAESFITWTHYNEHNQEVLVIAPEGNTTEHAYDDGTIPGFTEPYARRIGLLRRTTRRPGNDYGLPSRPGSSDQEELTQFFFYEPIFNQQCAVIEHRGNPIGSDSEGNLYFPPQNLGPAPTDADRSRYATFNYRDYQKNTLTTITNDPDLQATLDMSDMEILALIEAVDQQMKDEGLPQGFETGLGDVNGDGTGDATAGKPPAPARGNVVMVRHAAVRHVAD